MIVGKWRATRKWGHSLGSQLVKFEHIELLNCIASCIDTPSLELEPGSVWIQHLSIGQTLMVTPCFSSLVHIRYIRLSGTFFTTSQPLCMNNTSSYHAIPVHSFLHQNPHSLYSKLPKRQGNKFTIPNTKTSPSEVLCVTIEGSHQKAPCFNQRPLQQVTFAQCCDQRITFEHRRCGANNTDFKQY